MAALSERMAIPDGAFVFIAFPAGVMAAGIIEIWPFIGLLGGVVLGWGLFAEPIRRAARHHGAMTLPSVLRIRDPSARGLSISSALAIATFGCILGGGLVGIFQLTLTNLFASKTGVGIALVAVGAVTTFGGLKGVVWADTVHGCLVLIAVIALPLAAVATTGVPFASGLNDFPALASPFGDRGWAHGFASIPLGFVAGAVVVSHPGSLARYMAIRDVNALRRARLLAALITFVMIVAMTVVGLAGIDRYDILELGDPARLFDRLATDTLPPALAPLVRAAVVAMILSAITSLVMATASCVVYDLTATTSILAARTATLATTIVIALLSTVPVDEPRLLVSLGSNGLAIALAPALLALRWPAITAHAAHAGLWAGVGLLLIQRNLNEFSGSVPLAPWVFSLLVTVWATWALRLRGRWLVLVPLAFAIGRGGWKVLFKVAGLTDPLLLPLIGALAVPVLAAAFERARPLKRRSDGRAQGQ